LAVAGSLWVLWVMASASMVGGYLAGRRRRLSFDANDDKRTVRDAATSSLFGTAKADVTGIASAS